jgi:hypothetical protein
MLGGINNGMFFGSFAGFFGLGILILFLKWTFPNKHKAREKAERRAIKKSLQELKRK